MMLHCFSRKLALLIFLGPFWSTFTWGQDYGRKIDPADYGNDGDGVLYERIIEEREAAEEARQRQLDSGAQQPEDTARPTTEPEQESYSSSIATGNDYSQPLDVSFGARELPQMRRPRGKRKNAKE